MKKQNLDQYKNLKNEKFKLFDYTDANGQFDYEFYKKAQDELNKKKLHQYGPSEPLVKQLSYYVKREWEQINHTPRVGLCHGTRRGDEQKWFSKHLEIPVFGTDIAESANQFDKTFQWDFHDVKPSWINSIDFIYSNSLDHSYDPIFCLRQWFRCLKPGGLCILGWSKDDRGSDSKIIKAPEDLLSHDCFQGSEQFYEQIIRIAGVADSTTGLKFVLNTEFFGIGTGTDVVWEMNESDWGLQDKHFLIQKYSNLKRDAHPNSVVENND